MTAPGPIWQPYAQMKTISPPLPVIATEGVRLKLADGRVLIDGISSWWTACHGYNHPSIRAAIERQLAVMPHVMFGGLTHEPAARLAARLAELLPGDLDHVFFSDSGSVAVEVAMKMAVQFWSNRGEHGRDRFLSFHGGYHGDTLGAMSVTDPELGMSARLGDYVPAQLIADLPADPTSLAALDALLQRERGTLAAVIVEPMIQAAGGMKFHSADTLAALASLVARHGCLLILDEIMTGFGRTGSLFACEQAGIVPDIICLSKALTGGTMALAATVARRRIFDGFWSDDPAAALMHGPTFMANPLACAAALASLDLFDSQDRLGQVDMISEVLEDELEPCRDLPGVIDVRVKGAIGVVQLRHAPSDLAALRQGFIERGVWARPFGDILYVAPSFTINRSDLTTLGAAMRDVATDWSNRHARGKPAKPPRPRG
ncbi:MAG: adenosylmethionine--8-amino-7-oxononanoate transaminase [Aliidongia sp.]